MVQFQQFDASHASTYTLQELRIELLRACPLLCVHCSAYAAPHHLLQLPLQRVQLLIDEFAELKGHRVTFTGGEPLMYPGIVSILERCQQYGLTTRLFSSGIIFDGAKRVVGHTILEQSGQCLDTIMYSMYSADAETHNQVTRIPGSFQLTLEAIKHTVTLGIGAEIHFVPTLMNYQEFPNLVALAAHLNVSRVGILRFVPQGRGKAKANSLALGKKEHLWLRNTILELREYYPQLDLYVGSAYNLLRIDVPHPCSAAINQLVIEADGSIVPCSAFSNVRMKDEFGNILHHSLSEVWRHSFYLQQVRQALDSTHDCYGCLAQKTIVAGHVDSQTQDPLERLLS